MVIAPFFKLALFALGNFELVMNSVFVWSAVKISPLAKLPNSNELSFEAL